MELPEFPDAVRKSFWKPLRDCSLLRPAPLLTSRTMAPKKNSLGKTQERLWIWELPFLLSPEDRLGMGLVGDMDLTDNMMLRSFQKGHSVFTDRKTPKKLAENVVEELEVVTPGLSTPVRRLSGGNVQKVLVGREIASAPTVLMTAYAVRGLDINSSYNNLQSDQCPERKRHSSDLRRRRIPGCASGKLSDRILVLCGGRVSGILDGRMADKNTVGMMMTRIGGGEE